MRSRFAFLACAVLAGCARSEVDLTVDAGSDTSTDTGTDDGGVTIVTRANKLDLLLVVDNSTNLEVPQDLLAKTLPYLFDRLVHPACVNGLGNVVAKTNSPSDPCPVGQREFAPLTDIHVGILTPSLGGHGADICSPASQSWNTNQNDAGHLVSRDGNGGMVATYAGKGFLAWDPGQKLSPPGEADVAALTGKAQQMVRGVGINGCGYESSLESIYRFLVDPTPYKTISVVDGKATPQGTDDVLLQQRSDFLRPDSAVVALLVTDESDCSFREGGQYYLAGQGVAPGNVPYHLPRGRSECQKDPNDKCCASCAQKPAAGCPPNEQDPSCALGPNDQKNDPINLRCFDEKRRFGIDFLYPTDRYVNAFTQTSVTDRSGQVVPSPLLSGVRASELVVFAAITGVPWQDIAVDPKDLSKGYEQTTEIDWSIVLGDPSTNTPPGDPLMIESIAPRTGTNPVVGVDLMPPKSPPLANPINGHERDIKDADDLQYACIYARPTFKACNDTTPDCECKASNSDTNPLCQDPDGEYSNIQRYSKALPGVRQLRVVRDLGTQGVVGSICAAVPQDDTKTTFGYKPAIDAVLRSLRARLELPPDPKQ
jgi:hypothetical protein